MSGGQRTYANPMCTGGGSSGPSAQQLALQQQQTVAAAQSSAAQLAEQKREFDIQQRQNADALANTKSQEATQQAQLDQQAALTKQFQTGRAAEQNQATQSVNNAFSQFTPDYYKNFTKAYVDHYTPQVNQQFAGASNNTVYGLARQGNLQSQTAANQIAALDEQKGTALDDINNAAIGATTNLQNQVLGAKANLLGTATSDTTLGSPITPGSADAITAQFNNTSAQLATIKQTAGDTISALSATPRYSSLGSLFGGVAAGVGSAVQGNNYANNLSAFNSALGGGGGGGAGASNPNTSSGRVN